MPKAKKNFLVFAFFSWYIRRIIRSDFRDFVVSGSSKVNPKRPVLLLANHFSWWDGFFLFYLNRQYLKKRFFIMVSEENYRDVWFLKYLGAFAVASSPKEMLRSLEHAAALLQDPENLVVVFPQGKLHSGHVREVGFEKGVVRILQAASQPVQVLFSAIFTDYFDHRKPTVRVYLEQWEPEEFNSLQLIKKAYNRHYQRSHQEQTRTAV